MKKLNMEKVRPLIDMAIGEDLGNGDVTSELFCQDTNIVKAHIVSREEIVVCGMDVVREILQLYNPQLKLTIKINDGQPAHVGSQIGTIDGPMRSMLSAERVVLNFLQRLSGISTTTAKYVRAIQGTNTQSGAEADTITG